MIIDTNLSQQWTVITKNTNWWAELRTFTHTWISMNTNERNSPKSVYNIHNQKIEANWIHGVPSVMHITVVAISEEEMVFTMHIFLIITSLLITWITVTESVQPAFLTFSSGILLFYSSEMALCFSLRLSISGSRAVAGFLYLNLICRLLLNFSCWM